MASRTFQFLLSAKTEGWQKITTAKRGLTAFNRELSSSTSLMSGAAKAAAGLVGAYAGLEAVRKTSQILLDADTAAFQLESSLKAANREFDNVGSASQWKDTIAELGDELKVYSGTELTEAAARTVDMTKRLGLEGTQMQEVIKRSADLAAGKTSLTDAVERVTAALRGEAEASEYLGLTLNENYVKSWYEARGAMEGAWKDLDDMQKAQIRYQILLEQSDGLSGKAAESIKTLGGAWASLTAKLNNTIAKNGDLKKSLAEVARLINDNAGEIGDLAAGMVNGAAAAAKFALDNKDVILSLGGMAVKMYLFIAAVKLAILPIGALNAALLATTATGIYGWIVRLIPKLYAMGVAAWASTGPYGLLVVTLGAAAIAVGKLASVYFELEKVQAENAAIQNYNNGLNDKLVAKIQAIGAAAGVNINTIKEWQAAIKNQTIVYDQETGKWVKAHDKVTAAGKGSASAVQKATGDALAEMEKKYRSYVQTVMALEDEITSRRLTSAEKLREMSRSTMDGTSAWYDMKKEAEEYAAVAAQAEDAQDWEKAKEYRDLAAAAYARLNTAVEENGRVTVSAEQAQQTAMSGYEENTNAAIAALKEMQNEAATAADKMIEAAGFADLSTGLTDLEKEWLTSWKRMQTDTSTQLKKVEEEIQKIVSKTRTVYINVKTVESKSGGGMVGVQRLAAGGGVRNMLGGGAFPGFGGGDRRHVIGEDGEYMLNKHAVKESGVNAAHAYNTRNWSALMGILSSRFGAVVHRATGGPINSVASFPAASGMAAAGMSGGGANTYNITINTADSLDSLTRGRIRTLTDVVTSEIDRRTRRSSK